MIISFAEKSETERKTIAKKAQKITQKTHWNTFFEYYLEAYKIALK
jgi:hypothetical protein